MGSIFKKTFTKPIPAGAEIITRKGKRMARWKNRKGKTRIELITKGKDGTDRLIIKARNYTAKYRDGQGIVREVSTGHKFRDNARDCLSELRREAELIKAGVITTTELAVSRHQQDSLSDHFAAYIDHLKAKSVTKERVKITESRLKRVSNNCRFLQLADLTATDLIQWLNARAGEGMSAGARNGYREAMLGFGNWCRNTRRLLENPFHGVPKADAKSDCRRKRRSLTEEELTLLLEVANRRPLVEATMIRRGKRKGETSANVRDEVRAELERLGRERALIYKTLVLTGLRKGELASLTIGQLELDGPLPYVILDAADEKNRQGSHIPLRADLAEDLRKWVADMAAAYNARLLPRPVENDSTVAPVLEANSDEEASRQGHPCQTKTKFPSSTKLFNVPAGLVRILDRDLKMAGIPKKDERGRTVDVHALRHSFGTLLSKAGVAPRTAQAAMRHSTIDLTMNTYTDPKLLDVAGALATLPSLPLPDRSTPKAEVVEVRQCEPPSSPLAPTLAPECLVTSQLEASQDSATAETPEWDSTQAIVVSPIAVKRKHPLSSDDKGCLKSGRHDLNMRPLRPERSALARLSYAPILVPTAS